MAISASYVGDPTRRREVVRLQDRPHRLMRIRGHRAVKYLSQLDVRAEKIRKDGLAVDLVPRRLAGLDAVEQLAIDTPMWLFTHPDREVAGAARMIRAKRLGHRRIRKLRVVELGECPDTRTRAKQSVKRAYMCRCFFGDIFCIAWTVGEDIRNAELCGHINGL